MQQRGVILLIGIILTLGLSVVGGVGIVDVSAADTEEIRPETTENDTSVDTQTLPSRPGEVTGATTNNPSPSENRGAFAGVTPYTTADDVLGGIGNDAIIFQGEEDIVFETTGRSEVSPSSLERTAGANEGVTVELPIPTDQPEGNYANRVGFSVIVQEPRVTTLEVQNDGENDVSGTVLRSDQDLASVLVEYNYEEAEDIELTVEDEDGVDVTGEALDSGEVDNKNADSATPSGSVPDGSVRFELNPSSLEEGDYTFSVAGVEDIDSGEATQSVTTTISAAQTASLSLSEDEAVQGSDTTFSIENSPEGEFHPVVIDESEFRDGVSLDQAEDVFRNVGDVVETGVAGSTGPGASDISSVEYAYAIVEIDGGNGVGSVETQFLDDSSTTVELYPSDGVTPIESHPAGIVLTTDDGFETDDERDINTDTVSSSSDIDTTRSLSDTEVTNGSTVTVTIEGSFESSINDAKVVDSVSGGEIVAGNLSLTERNGADFGVITSEPAVDLTWNSQLGTGLGSDSVTIQYELTIPANTPLGTTITFDGNVTNTEADETATIAGETQLEVVANTTPETVTIGGQTVPTEFTTETASGERTVTADNAVSAINTFIGGGASADVAVDVINAFIAS